MVSGLTETLSGTVSMAEDAQGFDLDLNYTKEDNPFWDGTPAAHPAWDRGMQHTTKIITRKLQDIVLGPDSSEDLSFQQVLQHIRVAMETCNIIIIDSVLKELARETEELGLYTSE